ncbi:flagellar hook-associated protein FlgK [Thiomicrorhabdus sediminis]|uniref:Flagellar hook-associated protein 1 n=1 Tax=Thiomicrorhabdus sediminis TaxID=2580412 RepID=A0A4P9K609_9GAMM|nr:flagellar hook-associated protein FlgK [Thiomicrorhabdus sediminis]QCU90484.1 flagellar hook-associated protein FlgK [Thiomicrorhabdus sediminis]
MADMLTIATLSTNAYKKALEVTSHNVANVGTEGYSRQRVEFASGAPTLVAAGSYQGSGVMVESVQRSYAQYIQEQLYHTNNGVEKYEAQLGLASEVEGIIASNDEGVQQFLQRFFDSLQNLADNPTSATSRQMVVDEAGNLDSHIGNLTNILSDIQQQTNEQIEDITTEINSRLDHIRELNQQVEYSYNNTSNPPNDLLDQRDQAVLEISQYIDVKAYYNEEGRLSLYAGNGRLPLINGNYVNHLESGQSEFASENRTEVYMSIGDQRIQASDFINGGQLGGVLEFRSDMLDKAQKDLGIMLNSMTAAINWQHYQGYDADGNHGQSVFEPMIANSIASINNDPSSSNGITVTFRPTGLSTDAAAPPYSYTDANLPPYTAANEPATYGDKKADLDIALATIGEMEPREYEMKYNSTTSSFDIYERGKTTLLGSLPNAPAGSVTIDGLNFEADGGAYTAGDTFIIKPHQQILTQFKSVIENPDGLATRGQSPVDTGVAGLDDEVPDAAAEGDNVNVANMASLQSKKIMFSNSNGVPSESLMGGYSQMATNVGTFVRSTDIQLQAQTNVHAQVMQQRESISGVSLDEEASNLVRYQQAYEASAQIIATYQQIFQTLIGLTRG